MYKFFILLLLMLNIAPVTSAPVNYMNNNINYAGFNSKLRMNQPKTIVASHGNNIRQNSYYPDYCQNCYNYEYHHLRNDLNALEKYALNKTYGRENNLKRLERLENLAFGSPQYGSINSRYRNLENAILSSPKQTPKRSILNNLANYFVGQSTGFTPTLINSNLGGFSSNPFAYTTMPQYNNNSFEQYSNGIFGGGWGVSGNSFGTGSSVRILD